MPRSGLLERWFPGIKRFKHTASPPPGSGPPLDLDRHRLGDVGVGDSIDSIGGFGPVEDEAAVADGDHRYYSRGFWFSVTQGLVDSFGVFWRDTDRQGFLPFAGWTHFRQESFALHATTTEAVFVERFGAPYWRDRDREILLFYENSEIEWQVEFNRRKLLCALTVMSPPLLADPGQREMYRVTRGWPPPVD